MLEEQAAGMKGQVPLQRSGVRQFPLTREVTAARRARRHVSHFCSHMPVELRATAQLLTSELVSNAFIHGHGEIQLAMNDQGDFLRVDVTDGSPVEPHLVRPSLEAPRGRGLMLVESFASSWGVTPTLDWLGKSVWFTLDLD
jgi:anti-sigma regulatory factor (Ser/Thr protein kinase)